MPPLKLFLYSKSLFVYHVKKIDISFMESRSHNTTQHTPLTIIMWAWAEKVLILHSNFLFHNPVLFCLCMRYAHFLS